MHYVDQLPILILAYNRFDKFYKCITILYENGARNFYVSIDGPKNNFDIKEQNKIYNFCKENNLRIDLKINILKKNYGCRLGPIKGISWFFNNNKYGVILEDDVVISKACLETYCTLLQENIENKDIMSLCSFNEYANKEIESKSDDSLPILLKVDCGDTQNDPDHAAIMDKYKFKGYPTIMSFDENGEAKEYDGDRSKSGILKSLGL